LLVILVHIIIIIIIGFILFMLCFILWETPNHDILLAVSDHLVSDLAEEVGHGGCAAIVPSDGMDHLDSIHQSWESLNYGFWCALVERFNELFKDPKVFDIVLCLIELITEVDFLHLVLS